MSQGIASRAAAAAAGMFALFIAATPAPSAPTRIASTPEDLADQVREVRVYLTRDPRVVRSEIVAGGPTSLTELIVPMENGSVRFGDDGRAPDRVRGDGIFSATYLMDVDAEFRRLRNELSASSAALLGDGTAWVTRGPRDTVRARDALYDLRSTGVALDRLGERTAMVMRANTAAAAASLLGVNPDFVPFMRLNTGNFDRRAVTPAHLFGVPMFEFMPFAIPIPIDQNLSLMVHHHLVLDDPARTYDACTNTGTQGGAWSFGHLMREMSQGTGLTPEDFVTNWLATWQNPQTVNGWLVDDPVRSANIASKVIAEWQANSAGPLDVDKFPARLAAIVNRPDLADKIGYGKAGSAGEGRLVFTLYRHNNNVCQPMGIMVIFEYGIKGGSCSTVKQWHQRWKNLDAHAIGSAAYNAALEDITRDFTDFGSNPAQVPNQSALNQLRVNEVGLHTPEPWQLREFHLASLKNAPPGQLVLFPVARTPADTFSGSATLSQFLADNAGDILLDKHDVPLRYPTSADSFRGVTPEIPGSSTGTFWNADVSGLVDGAEVRRKFSLNTCNACHARETDTLFTHITGGGARGLGQTTELSEFLTGTVPWFTEPVTHQNIHYDDLQEREERMSDLLSASCGRMLSFKKASRSH
jgi:hypothetical protein